MGFFFLGHIRQCSVIILLTEFRGLSGVPGMEPQ